MKRYTNPVLQAIVLLVLLLALATLAGQILGVPIGLSFVETGSMEPTMEPGDGFIAVPPVLLGGVEEGDVVTFDAQTIEGGELTTHRVVGQTSDGYTLRGDANPFTDQQGGEPPVPRERIVAEALQIGGHVVVIPSLGEYVESVRGVFASIGARFGLSGTQVSTFVVVATLAAYLFSSTASEKRTDRSTDRSPSRSTGFSGRLLIGGAVAFVLATATLSMTASGGAIVVPYDSVEPGTERGGIATGTTQNASVELTNAGLVPMTAVLSMNDPNATLTRERVYLAPRSTQTVNVSITAPAEPGEYEVAVERRQYLAILPGAMLSELASVSHWLAVAVVDLLLAGLVALSGARLVGFGRIRLRFN